MFAAAACASISLTGESCSDATQSPAAKMPFTELCIQASVMMPRALCLTPIASSPRSAVSGTRPIAAMTNCAPNSPCSAVFTTYDPPSCVMAVTSTPVIMVMWCSAPAMRMGSVREAGNWGRIVSPFCRIVTCFPIRPAMKANSREI